MVTSNLKKIIAIIAFLTLTVSVFQMFGMQTGIRQGRKGLRSGINLRPVMRIPRIPGAVPGKVPRGPALRAQNSKLNAQLPPSTGVVVDDARLAAHTMAMTPTPTTGFLGKARQAMNQNQAHMFTQMPAPAPTASTAEVADQATPEAQVPEAEDAQVIQETIAHEEMPALEEVPTTEVVDQTPEAEVIAETEHTAPTAADDDLPPLELDPTYVEETQEIPDAVIEQEYVRPVVPHKIILELPAQSKIQHTDPILVERKAQVTAKPYQVQESVVEVPTEFSDAHIEVIDTTEALRTQAEREAFKAPRERDAREEQRVAQLEQAEEKLREQALQAAQEASRQAELQAAQRTQQEQQAREQQEAEDKVQEAARKQIETGRVVDIPESGTIIRTHDKLPTHGLIAQHPALEQEYAIEVGASRGYDAYAGTTHTNEPATLEKFSGKADVAVAQERTVVVPDAEVQQEVVPHVHDIAAPYNAQALRAQRNSKNDAWNTICQQTTERCQRPVYVMQQPVGRLQHDLSVVQDPIPQPEPEEQRRVQDRVNPVAQVPQIPVEKAQITIPNTPTTQLQQKTQQLPMRAQTVDIVGEIPSPTPVEPIKQEPDNKNDDTRRGPTPPGPVVPVEGHTVIIPEVQIIAQPKTGIIAQPKTNAMHMNNNVWQVFEAPGVQEIEVKNKINNPENPVVEVGRMPEPARNYRGRIRQPHNRARIRVRNQPAAEIERVVRRGALTPPQPHYPIVRRVQPPLIMPGIVPAPRPRVRVWPIVGAGIGLLTVPTPAPEPIVKHDAPVQPPTPIITPDQPEPTDPQPTPTPAPLPEPLPEPMPGPTMPEPTPTPEDDTETPTDPVIRTPQQQKWDDLYRWLKQDCKSAYDARFNGRRPKRSAVGKKLSSLNVHKDVRAAANKFVKLYQGNLHNERPYKQCMDQFYTVKKLNQRYKNKLV